MPLLRRPSSPARPAPHLAPLVKATSATAAHRWDVTYWTLFVCLSLFGIAPVWISDLLPLLDAGSHLHLMKIIHDFGDNALYQHHYKEVHAIVPYLSYYKAVDWLQYFTDVEQANRIVLSACLLGIPLASHALLKALHHNRWLVLGVFPWMLNSDFFMGFFNYLMSIPVFLLVLAAHVHFLRKPSWRGGALVGGLLVFLAVTHYLLWGVSLALLPLLAIVFGMRQGWLRGISWGLREVAIVLPSIAVLLPWFLAYFVFADGVKTPDQVALHGATWFDRLSRIYSGQHLTPLASVSQLFDHMFNRFSEQPIHIRGIQDLILRRQGELISSTWLLGIGLWMLGAVKRSRITMTGAQMKALRGDPNAETVDESVQWPEHGNFAEVSRVFVRATTAPASDVHGTSYIGWALAFVTAAYFILPQHLNRPIILYGVNFRLVEVLAIMAVLALPVCPLLPARHVRFRVWLGTIAMLVASVMMPIYTSGVFMLARTEFGSIREAFHTIPPNRSVLTLRMKRQSKWLEERVFSNIGEYYAIFRGGYVPYSFADSSSKPVITRPDATMPAPVWYDHTTFGMKPHGRYYDYIAVYRGLDERTGTWELNLRKWHKIYQRDHWQVFRNPAKAAWPPPTKLELARTKAVSHAVDANMELLGLGPKSTRDLSVEGLLELWNPDLEAMADPKSKKKRKKKKRKRRRRKVNIPRPQQMKVPPVPKPKAERPSTRRMGEPAPVQPRAFALPGTFNLPAKMPELRALRRIPSAKLKVPTPGVKGPSEEVEIGVPPHAEDPTKPLAAPDQGRAARGSDLGKPREKPSGWLDLGPAVRAFD